MSMAMPRTDIKKITDIHTNGVTEPCERCAKRCVPVCLKLAICLGDGSTPDDKPPDGELPDDELLDDLLTRDTHGLLLVARKNLHHPVKRRAHWSSSFLR